MQYEDANETILFIIKDMEESPRVKYICTYWSESGTWSTDGCYQQHSNATHTVCKCEHLSSFAVLVALYPMEVSNSFMIFSGSFSLLFFEMNVNPINNLFAEAVKFKARTQLHDSEQFRIHQKAV